MTKKKVTLKDIAEDTGVSISVVSRVLRNKKKKVAITPATKQRILESAIAHGLALNNNIGVFVPESVAGFDLIHYPFVAGVFTEANRSDSAVFSQPFADDPEAMSVPAFLEERKVAGAIFLSQGSPVLTEFCEENRIPVVLADIAGRPAPENCITIDYETTMARLLSHLKEQGYRRYIFASTVEPPLPAFEKTKMACFERFLEENGFEGGTLLPERSELDLLPPLVEHVRAAGRDSVFIADSRFLTVELIKQFALCGKEPGRDVGLVGHSQLSRHTHPPLPAVRFDYNAIGRQSVRMLQRILAGKHRPVLNESVLGELVLPEWS